MQDMRTVKQSINVCHPRQDLRDESHLLSLERSNSISRVGSIVNPKYRFFRKRRLVILNAKEQIPRRMTGTRSIAFIFLPSTELKHNRNGVKWCGSTDT